MHAPVPRPEPTPALAVEGLAKAFRGRKALDGISFDVPSGRLTVLLGPAGAGKTTTLRLIAGLDRPDDGRILIAGRDAGTSEPKDRDIAMIFDNLALYPDKTGFENIASPLRIRRVATAEVEERVTAIAAKLRIVHVLRRLPKTMSGGERQRVALGRALIRNPALFLLDEPLASLDAMLRIELRAELKRLQRELGSTFIYATPDFSEALAVADTVVLLRAGRVVQVARPQALYDDPVDREAARFVGAPEINLVGAAIEEGALRIAGGSIALGARLLPGALALGGRFEVGIRPEHLALGDPDEAPIRGAVADIEPLGLRSAVTVRTGEATLRLVADAAATRSLAVGETVGLSLTVGRLLAFDPATGARIV